MMRDGNLLIVDRGRIWIRILLLFSGGIIAAWFLWFFMVFLFLFFVIGYIHFIAVGNGKFLAMRQKEFLGPFGSDHVTCQGSGRKLEKGTTTTSVPTDGGVRLPRWALRWLTVRPPFRCTADI
jgi:hypothetical protein